MYPTRKTRKKAGRPGGRRRHPNLANWRVMQQFDEKRKADGLTLRDVAKKLGYLSASRVSEYFHQRIVAGPDMVRQLALAVGVSPIEALWRAEHYAEVLDYLSMLYELGWSWMKADKVGFNDSFGSDFAFYYLNRFGKFPRRVKLDEVPAALAHRYHGVNIYNEAGIFTKVSIVKPIAYAILLGIGLFPRRGEKQRREMRSFIDDLSMVASQLIPTAERAVRGGQVPSELSKAFRKPLTDAEEILPWKFYGPMRLAVVAEYVHTWCNFASRAYSDYARLALYEHGAFIGEPRENEDIWEWQRVDMPTIDSLKLK
jgi:transcriptional regulator with XRE-family HTH domain